MISKALGAQVIAIDINQNTLDLAKEMGASFAINANSNSQVAQSIKEITKGGAHVSIDALGSKETASNSIDCLKKRGKHIQVGLMTEDHKQIMVPMDRILAEELEIIGSHGMQAHKYHEMFQMILKGELHPEKLIDRTITLEEASQILPKMNAFKHSGIQVIDRF